MCKTGDGENEPGNYQRQSGFTAFQRLYKMGDLGKCCRLTNSLFGDELLVAGFRLPGKHNLVSVCSFGLGGVGYCACYGERTCHSGGNGEPG